MEEVLRPVIAAMFITIIFIYVISTYIKPKTGHKNIDNFLSYVVAQREQFAHAAVMVGIITLFTDYALDMVSPE